MDAMLVSYHAKIEELIDKKLSDMNIPGDNRNDGQQG
jgi:hypothetical protein